MLYPRLTNCIECASIPELLKRIDCRLAELGNSLYNNISFMLNQSVPATDMLQLIAYKRILMYKNINPNYAHHYSISKIASKVILLTLGCESKPTYTPTIRVTTTTTTTPCPTTTTTTTVAPITTTTTTSITPTTTSTTSSTTSTTSSTSSTTSTSTSSTTTTTTAIPTTTTTTTAAPTTTTTTTMHVVYNNFIPTSQTNRLWTGVTIASNNDVYATALDTINPSSDGVICEKLSAGTIFTNLFVTSRAYNGVAANPTGDIYAVVYFGGIYKQTAGTGSFITIGQSTDYFTGITSATNGDMYVCENNTGRVLRKLAVETIFTLYATTGLPLRDITIAPNGNIYICDDNDIYKQTGGVGSFVALGTTGQQWTGLAAAPNGDIFACSEDTPGTDGDIFVQYGATGSFVSLGQANRDWSAITVGTDVAYATVGVGDIYKMNF